MAEDNATTEDLPETVTRVAHQRMTDERNEARAEVDVLGKRVQKMAFESEARKHFSSKKHDDPEWAADIALPSILQADVELEGIGAFLDDKFSRLYPKANEPGTEQPAADDGIPSPDAAQPPGFAKPSPAAEGSPPGEKKYKYSDPEIQALINANDGEGLKKLIDAGQYEGLSASPLVPG
ncbi:hypothetical protein LCGC14_1375670 [marine sediment metagenome]|uniref:Uncharacterized protein n=1 Tax=marine sediment metagenome TaxID=412755 RepID=A0A0F9KQ23_9ZZZZ